MKTAEIFPASAGLILNRDITDCDTFCKVDVVEKPGSEPG